MNKTTLFLMIAISCAFSLNAATKKTSKPTWSPTLSIIPELPGEFTSSNNSTLKTFNRTLFGYPIEYQGPILINTLNFELTTLSRNCNLGNVQKSKTIFTQIVRQLIKELKSIVIIKAPHHITQKQIVQELINEIIRKEKAFNLFCLYCTISYK